MIFFFNHLTQLQVYMYIPQHITDFSQMTKEYNKSLN